MMDIFQNHIFSPFANPDSLSGKILISSLNGNRILLCRFHFKIEMCNRYGSVKKKRRKKAILVHAVFPSDELALLSSLLVLVYRCVYDMNTPCDFCVIHRIC